MTAEHFVVFSPRLFGFFGFLVWFFFLCWAFGCLIKIAEYELKLSEVEKYCSLFFCMVSKEFNLREQLQVKGLETKTEVC